MKCGGDASVTGNAWTGSPTGFESHHPQQPVASSAPTRSGTCGGELRATLLVHVLVLGLSFVVAVGFVVLVVLVCTWPT